MIKIFRKKHEKRKNFATKMDDSVDWAVTDVLKTSGHSCQIAKPYVNYRAEKKKRTLPIIYQSVYRGTLHNNLFPANVGLNSAQTKTFYNMKSSF